MKKKSRLREFIEVFAIACVIAFFMKVFVFFPTTVQGASMQPTLHEGDKVIVNKLAKQIDSYDYGDVIVVKTDNYYVKRIIGLPGDTIEMKNDQLYINSQLQKEPYLEKNKKHAKQLMMNLTEDFGPMKIPNNKIFVMGDNRLVSRDSRNGLGFIDKDDVLGSLVSIYYPFNRVRIID
ncbi:MULTISPECIES: signal peptidase I [unclassified Bacillus (in: firmicutes)]|uniref:signal peptidase I n=1 Tax=unclassified Bacillus (in: firmicutes) TaxID=185979 RepID=UPI0008F3EAE9|nr:MULTISPECIES: signal peptidase I [unclassified Bacillus (in: firmicutes)]SFJ39794.1 signal peptidase I [Bacillus sp. 71mf]SFT14928.1 signal peptidase I [Bacillus sp. 103mf]